MTSISSLGSTNITLQFELSRNIDAAAQDVQAAINAASGQLPTNLPAPPQHPQGQPGRRADHDHRADVRHPAAGDGRATTPTTSSASRSRASTAWARSIVGGQQKPAIRIQIDPRKVAALGLQLDADPRGHRRADRQRAQGRRSTAPLKNYNVYANDQILDAAPWNNLIVGYHNGAPVRVGDIGQAIAGRREQPDRRLDLSGRGQHRPRPGPRPGRAADRLQAARRQRHPDRRPHQRGAAGPGGRHPAGDQRQHPRRPHPDHPRLGARRGDHPADHRRAGGGGDLPVPAQRARDADPQRGHPVCRCWRPRGDAGAATSASTTCR